MAGHDLDDAVLDLRDRDIERATAQVVNQQAFESGGMRIVSQYRGGRLVDDANALQPRKLARCAGGLPLPVVEERRDGDHDLLDGLAERSLGAVIELPADDR